MNNIDKETMTKSVDLTPDVYQKHIYEYTHVGLLAGKFFNSIPILLQSKSFVNHLTRLFSITCHFVVPSPTFCINAN